MRRTTRKLNYIQHARCPDRVWQRAGQVLNLVRARRIPLAKWMLGDLVGLGEHACGLCSANVGGRAEVALAKLNAGNLPGFRDEIKWLRELTHPDLPYEKRKKLP